MPLRHWLTLSLTRGLGPILTRRIVALAGSAQAACDAGAVRLREIDGIGPAKADAIAAGLHEAARSVDAEMDRLEAAGASALCPDDASYPLLIKTIPDPPLVLYVRGALEPRDLHAVGIVGSRKCSLYGREQAERFATMLAGAGVTVISGGARGIDSASHRGALSQPNGRTIAVLGSGVDVAYPPENHALFEQIAAGRGAVISEYPMGTRPAAEHFPRRNRIISGLARGVIVVEADERSGALITARQACDDHGRPVFAVPGRVDNPLSQGPHQLLRDGAILCARLEDVLDNLGPLPAEAHVPAMCDDAGGQAFLPVARGADRVRTSMGPSERSGARDLFTESGTPPRTSPPSELPELPDRQQLVFDAVDVEPTTIDTIVEKTALPAQIVLQELTFLTLRALVTRVDGQTFVRRMKPT